VSDHPSRSPKPAVLKAIKVTHTVVWAFFVVCIVAIPFAAWRGAHGTAAWCAAIVAVEVIVLAANGWRCPLTSVAGRYTDERRDNFDIYLPNWLARHNKLIFGALYVAGVAFAVARWMRTLA
jgi:hypothetical protein